MTAQNSLFSILCQITLQVLTWNYRAPYPHFLSDPFSYPSPYSILLQSHQLFLNVPSFPLPHGPRCFSLWLFPWKSIVISPLSPSGLCSDVICQVKFPTILFKIKSHNSFTSDTPCSPPRPLYLTFHHGIYKSHLTHNRLCSFQWKVSFM